MSFVTLRLLSGGSVRVETCPSTQVSDLTAALSGTYKLDVFDAVKFLREGSELDCKRAVCEQVLDGEDVQVMIYPSVNKAIAYLERDSGFLGDAEMAMKAIRLMGEIGEDLAMQVLFTYDHRHNICRGQASFRHRSYMTAEVHAALGKIGERIQETRARITPFLVARLQSPPESHGPPEMISAMRALCKMGARDSQSQAALREYLNVRCPKQRMVAQEVLEKIGAMPASQTDNCCASACATATQLGETMAAAPDEETTTQEMYEAIQSSEQSAAALEQAHLHDALLRSKADARNADGIVIVRLTFHSPLIKDHLMSSLRLEPQFSLVRDAGCEASPQWAGGALFLVPMTHDQVKEADIHLKGHNIVLRSEDVELLKDVLKEIPKRARHGAELKPEHCADQISAQKAGQNTALVAAGAAPSANAGPRIDSQPCKKSSCAADPEVALIIERTFLAFPLRSLELSESSTVVQSAPAETAAGNEHRNPRRWV